MVGYLVLENGQIFEGQRIGFTKDAICEVVFNTSMIGYLEIFTDPSYASQGVVMTYPLIGNYGLTLEDRESKKPWVEAVFVHEMAEVESNFRSTQNIHKFLVEHEIPGLQGINTRKLTRMLRQNGTMKGMITSDVSDLNKILEKIKNHKVSNLVEKVSSTQITTLGNGDIKIGLLDFGSKQNIIQSLLNRNCTITVFPYNTSAEEIINGNFDAIVLSNGPGDPAECEVAIENIKKIYETNIPVLGIGLGHQLMALATGTKTYKLKYGHRGANHPVKDVKTGKVIITSQNHGYAIDNSSINPDIADIIYTNVNDETVEGLSYKNRNIVTVQYYPEGYPASYLYDEFVEGLKR